jgi:hypothetical protein
MLTFNASSTSTDKTEFSAPSQNHGATISLVWSMRENLLCSVESDDSVGINV